MAPDTRSGTPLQNIVAHNLPNNNIDDSGEELKEAFATYRMLRCLMRAALLIAEGRLLEPYGAHFCVTLQLYMS